MTNKMPQHTPGDCDYREMTEVDAVTLTVQALDRDAYAQAFTESGQAVQMQWFRRDGGNHPDRQRLRDAGARYLVIWAERVIDLHIPARTYRDGGVDIALRVA